MAGAGEVIRRTLRVPGAYLSVYLVGVLLTVTVVRLVQRDVLGGESVPLAVLTTLITVVAAGVLWARDPLPRARTGLLPWFLLALLGFWIYLVVISIARNEALGISVFELPIMIVLVAYRTPRGADAQRVVDVFAWAVIGFSAFTLALESAGAIPHWALGDSAAMIANERSAYFLPLADALGIEGRWSGPFAHPNLAGPVGAFLVILGATRRGANRLAFVAAGILILLLTSSRSALVAAVVGLMLLAAVAWVNRPGRLSRRVRVLVLLVPPLVAATIVVIVNPGLSGRTSMWPQIVDLWRGSPLTGIGAAGFEQAIDDGTLPAWAIHAHNVLLDAGVRTGVGGFLIALAVLVLAVLIAWSAARRGSGLGLALVGMIVVASMTDTAIRWPYLTGTLIVLVLAVLVSAGPDRPAVEPAAPPPPAPGRGTGPGPDPAPSS